VRIVFRVDGSTQIGLGHIMRCLTLATQFLPTNTVTFMSCSLPSALQQQIEGLGIQLLSTLPINDNEHNSFSSPVLDDTNQHSHAVHCIDILNSVGIDVIDILVIDHYQLSAPYSEEMRRCSKHIVVIDDLANREHECDVLIDQNLYEDFDTRYDNLVPNYCHTLLGPKFAILRSEFYSPSTKLRDDKHILICFGGSDPLNLTERVVDVLISLKSLTISADIVVGEGYANIETLEAKVNSLVNAELHVACSYISTLMNNATTMIGGGGSMHWERAATGVAGMIITLADNQIETTRCLHERHCCWWLGKSDEVTDIDISKAIEFAISSPQTMHKLAKNAASLVSGNKNPSFVMDTILNIITR